MARALEGIKVLDLSRALAGPYCTMMLADMGAEVIKVERPEGDPFRRGHGTTYGPAFAAYNRNKKSVVLDLKSEQGRADLFRLASTADVLVENYRPGAFEALGLGYEDLRKINPKLIYAASSGYGTDGPYRDYPAMDLTMQAMCGVIHATGFADTLDPKHGNKLGIIDIQRQYVMIAAALASGGSMSNFEPGKERLLACRKAGARIYPSNEAFAQALKTGEITCGIMWKARAVQWQNAGIKVETVAPKEGVPMYVSGFVMPKNAPNKEGAYAWLDAMMAASAQENFAIDMGYNPTVTNAKVADDLQKRIGFTPEEQKRLVDLDYGYMGKNDVDFQDWWNKSFKG